MKAAVEPIEIRLAEPDLIDRIANALPEETRAEYYRELRHCRSLPENDEMLRLLRAMQFLVLLIEQAPSRVAEERERLDKLLASTIANISKTSAASDAYHVSLQRKLTALPADIAHGRSTPPRGGRAKINESSAAGIHAGPGIPKTVEALMAWISDQMEERLLGVLDDRGYSWPRLSGRGGGRAKGSRLAEDGDLSGSDDRCAFHTRACREIFEGLLLVVSRARGRLSDHGVGNRDDI